jgi:hypothetical protein
VDLVAHAGKETRVGAMGEERVNISRRYRRIE